MMEDNRTGLLWLALLGTPIKYEEVFGNSWGLEDGQNEGQAVICSSVWLWRIMCWETREKGIILWDKVISREDPGSVWKMDCGKSSKGGLFVCWWNSMQCGYKVWGLGAKPSEYLESAGELHKQCLKLQIKGFWPALVTFSVWAVVLPSQTHFH